MRTRSTVLVSGIFLPILVACTSTAEIEAASNQRRAEIAREAGVRADEDNRAYVNCVLATAFAYASDRGQDSVSPGDVADASIAKCAMAASTAEGEMETVALANLGSVESATASAQRTMATIEANVRGQAIGLIMDIRRKKAAR